MIRCITSSGFSRGLPRFCQVVLLAGWFSISVQADEPRNVSGIYPHLGNIHALPCARQVHSSY